MFDLIVIGAGMAGMTSCLYALRNGKKVLILEKEGVGGQIAKSPKVENYPTVKEISGASLSDQMFDQILSLGAQFELENVQSLTKEGDVFTVKTDYATHQAKSVVLATGAKHRMLNLPNEEKFIGKGVYYCAICDGPFFAGEEVALIGDANSALQYALMLSSYCKKVHMFTLFERFFGEDTLQQRVREKENIVITHNASAFEFIGSDSFEGVKFKLSSGETLDHRTKAVFVAIGQIPDNEIYRDLADLDKNGYIIADEKCRTKTPGLFVAGDCRTKEVRQVTTAIGDGAVAGTNACKYLDSLKG